MPEYHEFRIWGREGGLKGGKLSWAKLSPEERKVRASHAGKAPRGERRPKYVRDSERKHLHEDAQAYRNTLEVQANFPEMFGTDPKPEEKMLAKCKLAQVDEASVYVPTTPVPPKKSDCPYGKSRWSARQLAGEPEPERPREVPIREPSTGRRFWQPSISTSTG
jgi:hypothetical protein